MSDNEIYLLIKYIKSVLWRVSKCLSYIEEARCLKVNQFMEDAGNIPEFLVQGITHLLPKSRDWEDPSKYRPITCLCTIYKIYTPCIDEKIYKNLETNTLQAEEQKGFIKNSQGCKEHVIVDSVVLEKRTKLTEICTLYILITVRLLTRCHIVGSYAYQKYTKQTH